MPRRFGKILPFAEKSHKKRYSASPSAIRNPLHASRPLQEKGYVDAHSTALFGNSKNATASGMKAVNAGQCLCATCFVTQKNAL